LCEQPLSYFGNTLIELYRFNIYTLHHGPGP
jgi:hypothetical protein